MTQIVCLLLLYIAAITNLDFFQRKYLWGPIHTALFFLIATVIPHIATNGLHRTQWRYSQCVTVTTSPASIQRIVSKIKSQLQIAQCERPLRAFGGHLFIFHWFPVHPHQSTNVFANKLQAKSNVYDQARCHTGIIGDWLLLFGTQSLYEVVARGKGGAGTCLGLLLYVYTV